MIKEKVVQNSELLFLWKNLEIIEKKCFFTLKFTTLGDEETVENRLYK